MAGSKQNASRFFPHPGSADEYGLLTVDPRMDVERLLDAYRHGIFPWPSRIDSGIFLGIPDLWQVGWYSPNPRAILRLGDLRLPRRLRRKLKLGQFRFTWNREFDHVLNQCATIGDRKFERWLSPSLMKGLRELHEIGHAHSVEAYHADDQFQSVCGGIYGVCVGKSFSAESMFHVRSDASKAALCALVTLLRGIGCQLLDIQLSSEHMRNLGAIEIPRSEFLAELAGARAEEMSWPAPPQVPRTLKEIEVTPADL